MELKRFTFLGLALCLVLFSAGCGDETLSAEEIYTRAMDAMESSNSYTFEMEMEQAIIMPEMMEFHTESTATGEAIEDPMALHMNLEMSMEGMLMDMEIYLVEEMMYLKMPEIGWVWQDLTDEMQMAAAVQDPSDFIAILESVNLEDVLFERVEDQYVIDLHDEAGGLLDAILEDVKEQLGGETFSMEEFAELFGDIDFSDVYYRMALDVETFLPSESTISYKAEINMMGEIMLLENTVTVWYIDYGSVDSITVPDEVRRDAIPYTDLF